MAKTDSRLADPLHRLNHENVLARILDNGLISVLLVSLEGRIVFANEACCRMVGLERADLITRNIDELVHPDDRETSCRDLNVVTTNEAGKLDFERRYVRRDGQTAWTK
jgi:PAS domain S-box-containing protein